jgi:molecular chaperone DnaK
MACPEMGVATAFIPGETRMDNIAVGIDLGTTFSAIAYVNDLGQPEIIPNSEGDRITPSVILFEDSDIIVGNYAKQAAMIYPEQVAEFVKRQIGNADFSFEHRGRKYSAEELSSYILSKLKSDAERQLGQPITQAVITVPAYFSDPERRATLRAGELAGLHVLKLINEPTAAAFAYGLDHKGTEARVLVFDLGGGTFDATLVDLGGSDIKVLATHGDHRLGGKDWDDEIIKHMAEAFERKHGISPLESIASWHDLRQKCVSGKISLSRRPRVTLFHDYKNKALRLSLTRERFDKLTQPLLEKTRMLTKEVLDAAGCKPSDVDLVLLAGGSTRMPQVRKMLTRLFGFEPNSELNPDECVAAGAALTAAIEAAAYSGEESPLDIRTHDVTSHSLGMVVYYNGELHNSEIISRNTRVPCEFTRSDYATTHERQTSLDLWLMQGESRDPLQCAALGHFEFYGILARPSAETKIAVTYRYNANGIVEIDAIDVTTGQTLPHRVADTETTLEDVVNNRVPTEIGLILDCSGSMYGEPLHQLQDAAKRFCESALHREHVSIGIVTFPGGVLLEPTRDLDTLISTIDGLMPIGSSSITQGIYDARNLIKPKTGLQRIFVVYSDCGADDEETAEGEAQRLHMSGARIIIVTVGDHPNEDMSQRIASRPVDCRSHQDTISLDETFVNLLTQAAGE